jgi:hypothetical protein
MHRIYIVKRDRIHHSFISLDTLYAIVSRSHFHQVGSSLAFLPSTNFPLTLKQDDLPETGKKVGSTARAILNQLENKVVVDNGRVLNRLPQ